MEGTNSKSFNSRLFTSNALLQKDELEEVSSTKGNIDGMQNFAAKS